MNNLNSTININHFIENKALQLAEGEGFFTKNEGLFTLKNKNKTTWKTLRFKITSPPCVTTYSVIEQVPVCIISCDVVDFRTYRTEYVKDIFSLFIMNQNFIG